MSVMTGLFESLKRLRPTKELQPTKERKTKTCDHCGNVILPINDPHKGCMLDSEKLCQTCVDHCGDCRALVIMP